MRKILAILDPLALWRLRIRFFWGLARGKWGAFWGFLWFPKAKQEQRGDLVSIFLRFL